MQKHCISTTDLTDLTCLFRSAVRLVIALGTAMTGKDELMKWEQIETKWVAMTRRIRADYQVDRIEPTGRSVRGHLGRDVLSAKFAENMTAPVQNSERKSTAK